MARPLRPEHVPRAERHPPPLEEGGSGVVAEAERPAVEPREVPGARRDVADLGQRVGEELGEHAAVAVELRDEPVQPGLPSLECGDRGEHAVVADVVRNVPRQPLDELVLHRVRAGDDQRALQPGDVPGLRRADQGDGAAGGLQGDVRDVPLARHRHQAVDLVRDHEDAVARGELSERLESAPAGARDRSGCGGCTAGAPRRRRRTPPRARRGRDRGGRPGPR